MLNEKFAALKNYLRGLESVAVAFSGGVDSTFLLKVAHDVLGDNAFAVTADSKLIPRRELAEAADFCRREKIKQVTFVVDPLKIDGFIGNPPDRCYICKRAVFTAIKNLAASNGAAHVVEGSNLDDTADYRPGMRAVAELGIKSPLLAAALNKSEIRALSRTLNLPTADKPSFACLASRFAFGEVISAEKLAQVERAEEFLRGNGFKQFRVRVHGNLARIEIEPAAFDKLMTLREAVVAEFTACGFDFVALDLQGYRVGSMNVGILRNG